MQVEVGTALNRQGRHYVCTELSQNKTTSLAVEGPESYNWLKTVTNVVVQDLQLDEYKAGDTIDTEVERVTFECPGYDHFVVYTKLHVRKHEKEEQSDKQGSPGSNQQADACPGAEVEGSGQRDSGSPSDGRQSIGEDRHPVYRD